MPRLSENAISFFGAGGHKHDGVSSTLISTDKYSLFDFNPGYRGSQSRITIQQANQSALEEWVMNLVNTKVLAPAGLDLAPGLLSGKSIRANTITATELQANTITADEIAANAVTANELAANLVLVNNVIRSNNYNGTIAANGSITANGNAGWAITSFGSAEFANAVIRGNVTANAGSIGGWNVDSDSLYSGTKSSNGNYATSGITIGSSGFISAKEFRLDADGNAYFKGDLNGANIVGVTGRFTGSVTVNGDLTAGGTTIYSNGQITNGGYTLSSTGVLTATGANISGVVNADSGTIGDWLITGSLYAEASAAFPGNSGLTIDLSPTDGIYAQRWQGSYVGAGYFTEVKILNGSATAGIDVRGNADGAEKITEIRSAYVKTRQVLLGAGENDLQTLLNGKANSHSHPYASDDHLHDSRYVNTDGDTMTGILYGTGIDMTGNLRYGGQVYSDEAGGYAEFGAVGAPTTIGGRVFRINQVSTLWSRSLSTTGSRPVFVNDDSTLFCGATVSSLRYKNNVVNSVIDTKAFLELDVVDFYYNDEFYEDPLKKTMELGVIAEQVHEKGLIDLVRYDEIGRPDGLNDNKIPFYLLKACIDQQAEIDNLKARIQTLEGV